MRNYLTYLFVLLSILSQGQGFRVRHYLQKATSNFSKDIFEISPGNYFSTGFIIDSASGSNKLCVMGLGNQGQLLWNKKYGNNKFQYLDNAFIERSYYKQGNYIYHAGGVLDSNNKYLGVLMKFNTSGDTIWQKKFYDSSDYVIPQMLTGSVDGGFLITGIFEDPVNIGRKVMLIKTDANGNELWRKKLSKVTPNANAGNAIVQDSTSGKIVIVGYQYIGNSSSWATYDNALITDSQGVKLSQRSYSGGGGLLYDVIQTRDKKIVAVGFAGNGQDLGGNSLLGAYIVKFDLNAPVNTPPIWKITNFDRLSIDNVFGCVREVNNGDLLIGGVLDTMYSQGLPFNCLTRFTKIDPNGNVVWNRYYNYKTNGINSDNNQGLRSFNLCSDGGWVAAIEVGNIPSPNPFFFVKYDSTGCDSTLAYCQSLVGVGIRENNFENNIKVYPNPAENMFYISFENSSTENYFLELNDVTGRQIKKLKLSGNGPYKIDLDDINAGAYLLTLRSAGGAVYKTKLIKQD